MIDWSQFKPVGEQADPVDWTQFTPDQSSGGAEVHQNADAVPTFTAESKQRQLVDLRKRASVLTSILKCLGA